VQRFLCYDCGRTLSVLPTNRLPYRPLEVERLQNYFDTQAGWASALDPPAGTVEAGCLQRAWQRLGCRLDRLRELFGQILPAPLTSARQCWQALRQHVGSTEQILLWLARSTHSSLLGDYRCLQPASVAG
jgi:hypothetical protein